MKFKHGDQVEYQGETWEVFATYLYGQPDDYVTLTRPNAVKYIVGSDISNIRPLGNPANLPVGIQWPAASWGSGSLGVPDEDPGPVMWEPAPPKCDCGGYKTYKDWAPHNHSTWCSSQQATDAKE